MRLLATAVLFVCTSLFAQPIPVSPLLDGLDAGQKGLPRVAVVGGDFLAAWTSENSVYVARFDAAGQPRTPRPARIADDAARTGLDVIGNAAGGLLVYQRRDLRIAVLRLSPSGEVVGSRTLPSVQGSDWDLFLLRHGDRLHLLLVTPAARGPKLHPRIIPIDWTGAAAAEAVIAAPSPAFAVANDGRGAVRWDAEGNLHFSERAGAQLSMSIVDRQPPSRREYPALAATASGYLAVWQTYDATSKIEAIRLDPSGRPVSPIFTLASERFFLTTSIEVLALGGERVAVTWDLHGGGPTSGVIVDETRSTPVTRLGGGPTNLAWDGSMFGLVMASPSAGRSVISVATAASGFTNVTGGTPVSIGPIGHRVVDAMSNGNEAAVLWTVENGKASIRLGGTILAADGSPVRSIELPAFAANHDQAKLATNGRDFFVIWCERHGPAYARMLRDGAPAVQLESRATYSVDAVWSGSGYLVSWATEEGLLHFAPLTDDGTSLRVGAVQQLAPRLDAKGYPLYRSYPRMARGHRSLLIVWQQLLCDDRQCWNEPHASLITPDGVVLDPDGVRLADFGTEPALAFDGEDFVAGWTDNPGEFARIRDDGTVAVASRGRIPSVFTAEVESIAVAPDGEVFIAWADYLAPKREVRVSSVRGNQVMSTYTTSFADQSTPFRSAVVALGDHMVVFGTIYEPTPRVYMHRYATAKGKKRRAASNGR